MIKKLETPISRELTSSPQHFLVQGPLKFYTLLFKPEFSGKPWFYWKNSPLLVSEESGWAE